MSTDQVRKMPLAFFLAVVKTLKKIISKFGHKS
jgi:hypothetical protein